MIGVHHYHVFRNGVYDLHSTTQRDHTRGWHAREGRNVLVGAQGASKLYQSAQGQTHPLIAAHVLREQLFLRIPGCCQRILL